MLMVTPPRLASADQAELVLSPVDQDDTGPLVLRVACADLAECSGDHLCGIVSY